LDVELPLHSLNVSEAVSVASECCKFILNLNEYQVLSLKECSIILQEDLEDLSREQENRLYEILKKDLLVVTGYPNKNRAFYTYNDESFDILYKGVEICSCSSTEI
jgi:aspartyl/asparaginyl-tRNA synthetase